MKTMTKIWFEDLFRDELEDAKANLENNRLWVLWANSDEEAQRFQYTIEALEEYIKTIENFKKQIEEA